MSATKLNEASTFTNVESKTYVWLDTCVDYTAPTRAEIDAGTDVTDVVAESGVSGFDETTNWLDSGNAGSKYTGKVAGRVSSGDSTIKTWLSDDGAEFDARSVWTVRGQQGVLLMMSQGDLEHGDSAGSKLMDSFFCEIGSISPDEDTEQLQSMTVGFGIKKKVARNIPIPAQAA